MTGSGAAPTLALVVITRNEEANIGRCLTSVSGLAEEMVVVDSGSTDGTPAIARAAGARVFTQEFLGYGRQKQLALEKAGCDWLLFLDADEWLDEEARGAIGAALGARPPETVTGYRLRRRTFYLGGWVKHAAWLNEPKLRLVRRGAARWKPDVVHESLELTSGCCRSLPGRILHSPYRDLAHQLQKIDRYTEIIAVRDQDTPAARILFGMILEPPLVFLQSWFLQLGFLDGLRGFLGASLQAFYFFLRYAKIWQRRRARVEEAREAREAKVSKAGPDAHGR
ncbi:MAG: glycosyltransferase family 2 protein [Holophagales bacterium]|nr:glycosyltransferase family 2 protein [Holophagales bacterium]MBK9968499.1 glycosyltransferase family 2 protein [Holophagales bacterium]